jgi:uncharacterized membrane-anchored protein YitT (DUF2179 family)
MKIKKWLTKIGLYDKGILRDYLVIILGAFIMALGLALFLVDAKVVPGGVSGLSMALYYLSGGKIPIGLTIWVFNVPLFIWGVKELGKQFGSRTLLGFTANSLFIDLLRGDLFGLKLIRFQESSTIVALRENDFILSIFCGAVLFGIGLGIIFKFRGSTAGSDIFAAVAQKRFGITPGSTFMVLDFVVISIAGLIIHFKGLSLEKSAFSLTLYAFFLLFVSSRLVDVIIDGFDYAKSAIIISSKVDEIAKMITIDLSRGATALEGRGLYSNQRREILYTVLTRKEIGYLVNTVKKIDQNAFIIVNNVHEVLGEGFRPRI